MTLSSPARGTDPAAVAERGDGGPAPLHPLRANSSGHR